MGRETIYFQCYKPINNRWFKWEYEKVSMIKSVQTASTGTKRSYRLKSHQNLILIGPNRLFWMCQHCKMKGRSVEKHFDCYFAWNRITLRKSPAKIILFHLKPSQILRHHFLMAAPTCWLSNHFLQHRAFFRAQLSRVNHFKLGNYIWWSIEPAFWIWKPL